MMNSVSRTSQNGTGAAVVLQMAEAIERMGDKDVYLEIAKYFADNLNNSLTSLGKALDNNQAEDATRLAHSLKSNCATVGAESLRADCYSLELLCRNKDLDAARSFFAGLAPRLLALREMLLAL